MNNPTKRIYDDFNMAYDFFNEQLFNRQLPRCLITMQRKNKAFGYFAGERFGTPTGEDKTDEIALHPSHFKDRSTEEVLSTLVHEMAHLWQHHFGKLSRAGYHNKEWASKMKDIGLLPSSTGAPGGKETGQKVSHYISETGPFARVCADLVNQGFIVPYVERWTEGGKAKAKKKAASKTKYTCASCDLNAWGKPAIHLICGDCNERMAADEPDEEDV